MTPGIQYVKKNAYAHEVDHRFLWVWFIGT